jgi:lipopolysaccharide/colanic/teichoic acid biosynthesis glycosyltransferase
MTTFTTFCNNKFIFFKNGKKSISEVDVLNHDEKFSLFLVNEIKKTFISDSKFNDIQCLNKYIQKVNSQLEIDDCFLGFFETFSARRNRLFINKIPIISYLFIAFDFLIHRVLPKTKGLNKIYYRINGGRNRLLSKAEVLGRLVYNGFKIESVKSIDGLIYFKARKEKNFFDKEKVSYGLFFKMNRIGKDGKLIRVYKIRTMHPYSEYIQDYVMKENGLNQKGKINRDFRLTPWGKFLRKFWIDEIPQLLNVLKGDMKLVGVRPVTEFYFKNLPLDLQEKRIKFKPGCIPPYVSMNSKSDLNSVLDAENKYLDLKIKNPYSTDLKFFFYAIFNIVFKGKRSS